ncbi:MAG: putative addiction module antidote protein [Acidobacteria bacterium]|nr:putative addiction module antidote protein [Acidobacteriota bacterium]
MPSRSFRSWQAKKLANPELAASYLNAAIADSPEMFLTALRNVAQARQVAKVAKVAGVARESVYRAFSEGGNPTFETLFSTVRALGLRLFIAPEHATELSQRKLPSESSIRALGHEEQSAYLQFGGVSQNLVRAKAQAVTVHWRGQSLEPLIAGFGSSKQPTFGLGA